MLTGNDSLVAAAVERPLALVRRTAEKGYGDVASAMRQWRDELEKRLQLTENTLWHNARGLAEVEGYLARVAAVLGTDVGRTPDWNLVVAAAESAAARLRTQEALGSSAKKRLLDAETSVRRAVGSTTALARVAARLGVSSTDIAELLAAIDSLHARCELRAD